MSGLLAENLLLQFCYNLYTRLSLRDLANLRITSRYFWHDSYLQFKFEDYRLHLSMPELQCIDAIHLQRIYALTADTRQVPEEPVNLEKLPVLSVNQIRSRYLAQLFDAARTHSKLQGQISFSYFKDGYFREGQVEDGTGLFEQAALGKEEDEQTIFFTSLYTVLFTRYLRQMIALPPTLRLKLKTALLNDEGSVGSLTTYPRLIESFMTLLAMVGGFPNRDWQTQNFAKRFKNGRQIREYYIAEIFTYTNRIPPFLELVQFNLVSSVSIVKRVKKQLRSMQKNYLNAWYKEQQFFYLEQISQFLTAVQKIMATQQSHVLDNQLYLSVRRIETLVSALEQVTVYEYFLRLIEIIIDETLLCITLLQGDRIVHAADVGLIVEKFISDTVGVTPQHASLRSSGMQAFWTLFQTGLKQFQSLREDIYLICTQQLYYEVTRTLAFFFPNTQIDLDKESTILVNLAEYNGVAATPANKIIHYYLANFVSNLHEYFDELQYTDIGAFIEQQRQYRVTLGCDEPLMVLIDNTSSDFGSHHLSALLKQYEKDIAKGWLCILVCHSGNKYLHLGLDKALASLIYGFYNPQTFKVIEHFFQRDVHSNQLGDLLPTLPTVTLTTFFLQHALAQVLSYSVLIRQRTEWILRQVIPEQLMRETNLFSINRPSAQIESNFITIKIHETIVNSNEAAILNLKEILELVKFRPRNGFGFSETTYVYVESNLLHHYIRFSIGTESLALIADKFLYICNYLLINNALLPQLGEDRAQNKSILAKAHHQFYASQSPRVYSAANQSAFFTAKRETIAQENPQVVVSYP